MWIECWSCPRKYKIIKNRNPILVLLEDKEMNDSKEVIIINNQFVEK
jgi:hypothetical protein